MHKTRMTHSIVAALGIVVATIQRLLGPEPGPSSQSVDEIPAPPQLFDWEREGRFPCDEEPRGAIAIVGRGRGREVELPPRWTRGPMRPI